MPLLRFGDRYPVSHAGPDRGCDRSLGGPWSVVSGQWSVKFPLGSRGSRRAEGALHSRPRARARSSQGGPGRAVGVSRRVLRWGGVPELVLGGPGEVLGVSRRVLRWFVVSELVLGGPGCGLTHRRLAPFRSRRSRDATFAFVSATPRHALFKQDRQVANPG